MIRVVFLVAVVLPLLLSPGLLFAQTKVKQADALNKIAKKQFDAGKYDAAIKSFQRAIRLSPEARFYFNLCYTHDKAGDKKSKRPKVQQKHYRAGMSACRHVAEAGASTPLQVRTNKLMGSLWEKIKLKPDEPATVTGKQPPMKAGTRGPRDPKARSSLGTRPARVIPKSQRPYEWALGVELVGGGAALGNLDEQELALIKASVGLPLTNKAAWEIYAQYSLVSGNFDENFHVSDVGAGVRWASSIGNSNWMVSLGAGLHNSVLIPENQSEGGFILTAGVFSDAGLVWLLGKTGQHGIRLGAMLNVYVPGVGTLDKESTGLDSIGSTYGFIVGYTRRFLR